MPRGSTENFGRTKMINTRNAEAVRNGATRRWVVAAAGIAVGRMMAGAALGAVSPRRNMKEVQTSAADKARTSLHQEIDLNVCPGKIYEAPLDLKQCGLAPGFPGQIDSKAGGAFKTLGGLIEGPKVELVSN